MRKNTNLVVDENSRYLLVPSRVRCSTSLLMPPLGLPGCTTAWLIGG